MTNRTFKVAGVTKENENKKDIQGLLKRITAGYKREGLLESWDGYTKKEMLELGFDGSEFQDQEVREICRFVEDPNNPYDSNAIKVYLTDASELEHHIGYVKKDETEDVRKLMNNNEFYNAVEFTGGKIRTSDYDVMENKDFFEEEELTRGLLVHFKSNVRIQKDLISDPQQKQEAKQELEIEPDLEFQSKSESEFANITESENKVILTPVQISKEEKKRKAIEVGGKMEATGKKMQKTGSAMMGCGCLLTLLITIPIIIIFLFFL